MTTEFHELERRAQELVSATTELTKAVYDGVRACYPINQVPPGILAQVNTLTGCVRNVQEELVRGVEAVRGDLTNRGVMRPPPGKTPEELEQEEWERQSTHRPLHR